jgi:hypothetical protein
MASVVQNGRTRLDELAALLMRILERAKGPS